MHEKSARRFSASIALSLVFEPPQSLVTPLTEGQMRAEPALIPQAVEEWLRHASPVVNWRRQEIRVMIEELTAAFPKMTLVPGQQIDSLRTISFRGPHALWVDLNE